MGGKKDICLHQTFNYIRKCLVAAVLIVFYFFWGIGMLHTIQTEEFCISCEYVHRETVLKQTRLC